MNSYKFVICCLILWAYSTTVHGETNDTQGAECENCPKDHADCHRGFCVCKAGRTGDMCECPSVDSCSANNTTDVICSSHGTCECGVCKCESPIYSGKFCEIDAVANKDLCERFEPCVRCLVEERLGIKKCRQMKQFCLVAEGEQRYVPVFTWLKLNTSNSCSVDIENMEVYARYNYTLLTIGQNEFYSVIQFEPDTSMPLNRLIIMGVILVFIMFLMFWLLIVIIRRKFYKKPMSQEERYTLVKV